MPTTRTRAKKAKAAELSPDLVAAFAREFAEWRLGGCPGYGFLEGFKDRLRKAARPSGWSFAEAVVPVHREAYRIIDEATAAQGVKASA
jgi:hypothetical protein